MIKVILYGGIMIVTLLGIYRFVYSALLAQKHPLVREHAKKYLSTIMKMASIGVGFVMFVMLEGFVVFRYLVGSTEDRAKINFLMATSVFALVSIFMGFVMGIVIVCVAAIPAWGRANRLNPCEGCGSNRGKLLKFCSHCQKMVCEECSVSQCKLCGSTEIELLRKK